MTKEMFEGGQRGQEPKIKEQKVEEEWQDGDGSAR